MVVNYVLYLFNALKWKTAFGIACKEEGQFDVVELMVNNQSKPFCINLNA